METYNDFQPFCYLNATSPDDFRLATPAEIKDLKKSSDECDQPMGKLIYLVGHPY